MKLPDIARYRLANQQIIHTKIKTGPAMVAWFGAMQAQEYAQTKWALGLRLQNQNDFDIENDFSTGKILRTHLLRPTWHFVAAEDIRWMLKLTASRVNAANAFMYRKLELESKIFNRCNNILEKELAGGNHLTRDALNAEFKKSKIKAEGHRLSYIMMRAELDGIICSGARKGNQFTYALLEERIPEIKAITQTEALDELAKRYFASRGPATLRDFSTWSGLTLTECKKGIESVKSHFVREEIDNEVYYHAGVSSDKKDAHQMHLLPIYDEFIMGYKSRDAILYQSNNMKPRPVFHYDCTIISEGQIIGTWKRTVKPKSIHLAYDFFKPLNKIQRAGFEKAILRFEDFTGLKTDSLNE